MILPIILLLLPVLVLPLPPNILMIVADDLGYNDISWHNQDIISPNLDKLAKDGIILESHYVQPICSPTRSALMTGFYPIHTGRQHDVIHPETPIGLFTNFTILPEYFKEIGYRTHAIGKWHLGFCHRNYLPTNRGFDTFYGFYLGSNDYYTHSRSSSLGNQTLGYDFRRDDEVDSNANGTYSSILLAERAVELIQEHADMYSDSPMFMYLPFQNVHSPLQVPKEYEELYPNIKTDSRRILSGMVTAMDDAVGSVVQELNKTGLLDNTIILFMSDNGASVGSGNNYPLRGSKHTLWEGGTRTPAFIYAPWFKNKGTVNRQLIHVVDWIPTFLTAVNQKLPRADQVGKFDHTNLVGIDGIDQWMSLIGKETPQRKEILYNIDPLFDPKGNAGIRIGDFKLLVGNPGDHDGHYPPDPVYILDNAFPRISDAPVLINGSQLYLFNIQEDPNEYNNIALDYPEVVSEMMARLEVHQSTMIPPNIANDTEMSNPNHFDGAWSPGWCDSLP